MPDSATFAATTTLTSTGAVDSHDSYTSLGGAVKLVDMLLGDIAPGGTGEGLYGMLVLAVITVFVAGLMVGRMPEYLREKRLGDTENTAGVGVGLALSRGLTEAMGGTLTPEDPQAAD